MVALPPLVQSQGTSFTAIRMTSEYQLQPWCLTHQLYQERSLHFSLQLSQGAERLPDFPRVTQPGSGVAPVGSRAWFEALHSEF